jgi:hypothetical protein
MSSSARVTLMLTLAAVTGGAGAATLSHNPHGAKAPHGQMRLPNTTSQQTITQSSSTAVTGGNSVSCNDGAGAHTDNSYYRGFTLSTFPALTLPQYTIQQVTIGVEDATSGTGSQPITMRLWSATANPINGALNPPGGVQVATDSFSVSDQSVTLLPLNVTTPPVFTVASGILAVEIFTPDGAAGGNLFFFGSNAAAETGSSYLKAADCGVPNITTTAGIGFGGMHIVMNVFGNNQSPVELQTFGVE